MEKAIKKLFINLPLLVGMIVILPMHNAYAGWLDNVGKGLQSGLSAIPGTNQNKVSEQQAQQQAQQQQNQSSTSETAIAKKSINVRSGPGTSHNKVGSLSAGTSVSVLETEGQWIRFASANVSGWAYKPLFTISSSNMSAATNAPTNNTQRQNVYYVGYSKDFQPVKNSLRNGDLESVERFFSEREKKVLKDKSRWDAMEAIGLLRWMERGTLYLDKGNKADSIRSFTNAETIIDARKEDSKLSDIMTWGSGTLLESATGNEEFLAYPGEGYEKVLMLNYKSIAFLLTGDRKAYNIARRAIDWQNIEKKRFDEEIKSARKKASKEESSESGSDWKNSYKKLDKIAAKVPSAYVNPFGYYVTGMIQEFESRNDKSLRDNARIAYTKALELNPESKVLKQAVKDMKNKKFAKSKRLLHVVVADGFVPEKKMLQYNFPIKGGIVPVKLPIYEPVQTSVARVEVHSMSGKRLAKLSSVADIEAICLRHQKDTQAFRTLRVGIAIARSVGVNETSKKIPFGLGSLIANKVNDMGAPDMRSWMSLPASIQAARFTVANNTAKIKIVSFDAKGRRLATKTVALNKQSDNFVYARSIDKQLYVQTSDKFWKKK